MMFYLVRLLFFVFAALPSQLCAEGPSSIRVGAYNIKHGQGMDGKMDLSRSAEVILEMKLDLVALQEVDESCKRSGNVDQAKWLGEKLGMHHRFGHFMDFQGGRYGLAILSKFPIISATRHPLSPGAEPRCALEVVVRPPESETPFSFVSIHHDWTKPEFRTQQVKDLILALKERTHPVILAGDFNAKPGAPSLKLLREDGFVPIAKEASTFTFPSDQPKVEIDFLMVKGLVAEQLTCQVHTEKVASDHRPISATIPVR